jgi:poly(3-hydroxybutyrate) depolymerase
MKKLYLGLFAVMGAMLSPAAIKPAAAQAVTNLRCDAAPAGQGVGRICTAKMTTGDGVNQREFRYYVPDGLQPNKPMVIVYHGGKTDSVRMMSEGEYAWNKRADAEGFIAVFPDGKPEIGANGLPDSGSRNWNDCRAVSTSPGDGGIVSTDSSYTNWDDVKFTDNLLKSFKNNIYNPFNATTAARTYTPDMASVYATGPSNGGMMTQRLARESIGSRFKGFASSIANLPVKDKCPATPASAPANNQRNMLLTFGVLDEIMPYNGGCLAAPFVSDACDKGRMKSAAQTIAAFSSWYGAPNKSDAPPIADGTGADGPGPKPISPCSTSSKQMQSNYRAGNLATPIRLSVVTVSAGGHSQPGAVGDPQIDGLTRATFKLGCRNLDRSAVTYITDFWGL